MEEGVDAGFQGIALAVFQQQICQQLQEALQNILLALQAEDVQLHAAHQACQCCNLQCADPTAIK